MNRIRQGRNETGKFTAKSEGFRKVRSIRLTDATWDELGKLSDQRCITRADLIEELTQSGELAKALSSEIIDSSDILHITTDRVRNEISSLLNDPVVTRNGKDKGSVKRALQALLHRLS